MHDHHSHAGICTGRPSNTGLFLSTDNIHLFLLQRHLSPFDSWPLLLFRFSRVWRQSFAIGFFWSFLLFSLQFLIIHHSTTPSATGSVTGTPVARDEDQKRRTIPTPTFARRPSTRSSLFLVDIPQQSMVGQQRQQRSELQFDKFPTPFPFLCWKVRFKNQVTTWSDFPSEAVLRIKEVEMVDSSDELKSSRSIAGKNFHNFWDVRCENCFFFEWDHPKFSLQEEGQSRGTESPERGPVSTRKTDHLHDLRLLWVTGAHDTVLDYADLFSVTLRDDNVQEFDTRSDEALLSMSKIPSDDVLESLYKLRIRESHQLKTVLELYDMKNHQEISDSNYQRLQIMAKRRKDQKLRLRNFDARHEKIETSVVVKGHRGWSGVERGKGICYQVKERGQCSKGDQCTFRHESNDQPPSDQQSSKTRGRSASRKRNARGRSQSEKFNRPPCKYFLKGTCTESPCDYWHPPECQFDKTTTGCKFGAECSFHL